jgi:hypothetical protein
MTTKMKDLKPNRMRHRIVFLVLMAALLVGIDACGGGSSSAPPVSVSVTASASSIPVNGTATFTAAVMNSSNQSVTWAVKGGSANGTISASGFYTAPSQVPSPAQVTITATPQANTSISGSASITITIGVSISPTSATVQTLNTTSFTAAVQGSTNQSVNWEVNGIQGGSISVGTISASGVYQAPESVPANASSGQTVNVTVEAVAQANASISASATVTITSSNQLAQNLPIELGTSGGNIDDVTTTECAGGTLGSLVTRAGTQYILSNNHVLADEDAGSIGDAIIQPGLIDTASPCSPAGANTVAHLSQFITLQQPAGCTSNCTPPADAAIAQVVTSPTDAVDSAGTIIELGDSAPNSVPTNEAPSSTVFSGTLVPNSTAVAKSGRSTGLTCSTIEATDFDVSIQYTDGLGGPQFTAEYTNQIAVNGGTFSAEGDSGSLIVAQANAEPIALLYGGSSTETVGAPAQTVLNNLADSSGNKPTFVGTSDHAVAGCTSSGADAFNATAPTQTASVAPSAAEFSKADAAANQNASQLMSEHPALLAVGVAPSLDRPTRAAVVLFIRKGQPLVRPIPHNVSGVPTRVISVDSVAKSGLLDQQTTESFVKSAGPPPAANPTAQQLAAAKTVNDKYAASLMKQPGILGVGVTSSLDNPSEAAIMVFVEEGKSHNPIPLELDGIRVRVKSTSKFRAFGWGHQNPRD